MTENLYHLASQLNYPKVMVDRTRTIDGPGFFPCASQIGDRKLEERPIMVLGQDQDSETGHKKSLKANGELYSPTWRNMKQLLDEAEIDLHSCFFTNFIMGVRAGSGGNTGPSPAVAYPDFIQQCADLFLDQVKAQRPRLIITLGMMPLKLLALVSVEVRLRSVGINGFKDLDEREMLFLSDVHFDGIAGFSCTVVPICHPCYSRNGAARHFSGHQGIESEVQLLKHVNRSTLSVEV